MRHDFDVQLVMREGRFGLLGEREEAWTRYSFDILANDGDGDEQVIGHMKAAKLSLGETYRQGIPLRMAFDDHSDAAVECYNAVFDRKGRIRKAFRVERYGEEEDLLNDFHLLESIEIGEKFKGGGLAGIVTQIYLENFAGGEDIVYLKAYPLQYEAREEPYERPFAGGLKECQAKLCRYYERLGFRRIGRSPHFFFVVNDFLAERKAMGEEGGRGQ